MPSRRATWTGGLLIGQTVLFWATAYWPGLGVPPWHHLVSLALVLVLSALLWRPLTGSRRFLALGVLATSVLALTSGFWLIYWKEGIRADGLQDWGVFWHVLWSWAAAVFFAMHTWINRRQFTDFLRRSVRTARAAGVHLGAYVLLVVAFLVTWSPDGRTWFTNDNYNALTFWTWLVAVVPAYGLWSYLHLRATALRARFGHWPVRRVIDLALVPTAALTVLSGIPLAFMDPFMDRHGFKYVVKYWHVWPSVLFALLAFVHTIQAWPTVRAHWRKYGTPTPRASPAPTRVVATQTGARSR